MSKPVFQALVSEMRRRNDFSVKYNAEKPGTRMSKRDRIQEILAQRFSIGSVHLKKDHHELEHEVLIFGPRFHPRLWCHSSSFSSPLYRFILRMITLFSAFLL